MAASPTPAASIYFPAYPDPSVHYKEVDFAKRTRWAEFLEARLAGSR